MSLTPPVRIDILPPKPPARHEHTLRRFSRRLAAITALGRLGVDREDARRLIEAVCDSLDLPAPLVTFHRGRSPFTGYCRKPRSNAVELWGEAAVVDWEKAKRQGWPPDGMIRLGDPTSLATVAHELGHHLVNHRERPATPGHGKAWVHWFDLAAAGVGRLASVDLPTQHVTAARPVRRRAAAPIVAPGGLRRAAAAERRRRSGR